MKPQNILLVILVLILLCSSPVVFAAGDFAWMPNFNKAAETDPLDFKARLSARFKIGEVQIDAVLSKVGKAADAYMVLRLGEMSGRPTELVIEEFNSGKAKGWGALAKSLGIKPGSKEFHALKRGDDIYGNDGKGKSSNKGKGKGKSKGKSI